MKRRFMAMLITGARLVSCVLLAYAYAGAPVSLPAANSSEVRGNTTGSAAVRMRDHFPNVVLKTHENKTVRFYDDLVKGKVVLISFMFTSCEGICPRTTANLSKVQNALGERLGRDVFLYSISLDPARDTPAVLKKYAQAVGAKPGWSFLTGKREDVELLRRKLGLVDPDPVIDADKTQHMGMFVYGNETIGRWLGIPSLFEPDRIVKALLGVMGPKK